MIVIYSYCTITKTICYYYTQLIINIKQCVMSQMFNSLKDRKIIMNFMLSLSLDIMSRLLGSNYIHIYIYSP